MDDFIINMKCFTESIMFNFFSANDDAAYW